MLNTYYVPGSVVNTICLSQSSEADNILILQMRKQKHREVNKQFGQGNNKLWIQSSDPGSLILELFF